MTFVWTDEKITELLHLWNFERLSSAKCGEILGITRNAVIGKVHRLKLPERGPIPGIGRKKLRPGPGPMFTRKLQPRPPRLVPEIPEVTTLSTDTNVTIENLQASHCRDIIGHDNGEPVYCGAPRLVYLNKYEVLTRSSYCPVHFAINHQPDRGIYHGYRERSYRR